ncbi:MAG: CRTAC1 family protein [Luteitalea sp.]|nr:CRTAC1 family protein [Luteitalea sp.]
MRCCSQLAVAVVATVLLTSTWRGHELLRAAALGPNVFATADTSPQFRNAAKAAGLTARLENDATADKHLIETMTGGVAAFDYDNDGLVDVYFVNGAEQPSLEKTSPAFWNRLYRNRGNLEFEDVTEQAGVAGAGYGIGVAVADYDNDGHTDLFVAGVKRNVLYRNEGDGTFKDVTAKAGITSSVWSVAAGWFDYDNDGLLDLFVVNYVQWDPQTERFCGDRARNLRVYCHPKFYEGLPNTLYRNLGNGRFEDVSDRTGILSHVGKGMSVAFADYDEDGRTDVFVTNDGVPNFLFRNRGDSTFEEVALLAGVALPAHGRAVSSMGVDFRDYDNDGRPDIAVTALAGETFPLFRNEGAGTFQDVTYPSRVGAASVGRSGWANAFVDLDNDGWKDLFTANSHVNDLVDQFEASAYRQANSIFRNASGTFDDSSTRVGESFAATAAAHRGAAFADFNNDGRIDVVTTALGDAPELWENLGPAAHWLRLELEGTTSNRDGLGVRVQIGKQTNSMTTAVGYASSSKDGVHFGVGDRTTVDEVRIRWPSGVSQVLRNVKADAVVRVREATR